MKTWYVVDLQGLYIDSEHEGFAEANERAVAFKREGGQPKVMTKPRVGSLELDPRDAASWKPKRTNPGAYRTPFICPACGGKGPGTAATVVHRPGCVLVKREQGRKKTRSNPPLEDHVEFEPRRTVRALRTRYGVDDVEHMLHDEEDIERQAEKHDYMRRHEAGLRENPSRTGEDIYRMWHQKEPRHATTKRAGVDWEDELVCVGKAHHIVYRSAKWEKGNKTNDYIHHFDSKPSVYMKPGVVEDAGATKSVKKLFGALANPDGKAEVAELARPLSFALDDGTTDGHEIPIHAGAKVYGGVDKKTVLIIDPKWGPIVIKGGKMYFDERGIVL